MVGLLSAGLIATGALGATAVSASLGGFSATVANPTGSAGSGTLLLREGQGSLTCISTGSGTTSSSSVSSNDNPNCPIELLGAATNLVPGGPAASSTVTLDNPGSVAGSSLSLSPGSCTSAGNADPGGVANTYFGTDTAGFCAKVDLTVEQGSGPGAKCVFPAATTAPCSAPSSAGTLASLAATTLPGIAAGASTSYTFSVSLDASATNADQGLAATLPLTWTLDQ